MEVEVPLLLMLLILLLLLLPKRRRRRQAAGAPPPGVAAPRRRRPPTKTPLPRPSTPPPLPSRFRLPRQPPKASKRQSLSHIDSLTTASGGPRRRRRTNGGGRRQRGALIFPDERARFPTTAPRLPAAGGGEGAAGAKGAAAPVTYRRTCLSPFREKKGRRARERERERRCEILEKGEHQNFFVSGFSRPEHSHPVRIEATNPPESSSALFLSRTSPQDAKK